MSDFDEEAERERLRRQFEADEKKREVTERMSELLLQGATMTNRHCDTCHSPVFKYQGQAFCPTCQVEIDDSGDGGTAGADGATAADTGTGSVPDAGTEPETTRPDADGEVNSPTRLEVDDPDSTDLDSSLPADAEPSTGTAPDSTTAADSRPSARSSATEPVTARGSSDEQARVPTGDLDGTGDSHLATAQASLSRTLSRLSRNAERSEDLSRTREYLLAAQEAAEALTALKEARR